MIKFNFSEKKATQVACLLLKQNQNQLNYTKLMKLLYLIDREALKRFNHPISGDKYCSMPRGPILSRVLDFINYPGTKGNGDYWHRYISSPQGYNVDLIKDPGVEELSQREIDLVGEINKQFELFDWKKMIDYCHRNIPEWSDPGKTSSTIFVEDILKNLNKSESDIESIGEQVEMFNYLRSVIHLEC